MAKYRKKPIVIEAVQWHKHGDHPQVLRVPESHSLWDAASGNLAPRHGYIETLEGGHIVSPGDWVIKGVKGEFYPVKDEIFKQTYEAIDDVPQG